MVQKEDKDNTKRVAI